MLDGAEELIVGSRQSGVPMLSKIPYYNRLYKNTGNVVDRRFLGPETISAFEVNTITVKMPISG